MYHSVVTETQLTAQKMDLHLVISKNLGQRDESYLPRLYTVRIKRNENGHGGSFLTLGCVIKCAQLVSFYPLKYILETL